MSRKRIVICGAAGRDFHCFNTVYRDDPTSEVVAFTATQIPDIAGRRYPYSLAGPLYPDGIRIADERNLEAIAANRGVDQVVHAYSDVPHEAVMHLASRALALGADFLLLGPNETMLRSSLPVIAVSAVRTGCGKSQISRWLTQQLQSRGIPVAAIRHPMPYGDLHKQRLQRFATVEDLEANECTAEEREEYEPYIEMGSSIFSGVDYAAILEEAEKDASLIVWDGGNNDFPFIRPDLHIVVVDALRPDHLDSHHPGEAVLRMADLIVINKLDAVTDSVAKTMTAAIRPLNQRAPILRAASPVELEDPEAVRGRRALVVEDGPTMTHGGMSFGAGTVAAIAAGPSEIVDPRESATPALLEMYARFPHLDRVLPTFGYNEAALAELRQTIVRSAAEVVVSGAPIDLARLLRLDRPVLRARYSFQDLDSPGLLGVLEDFLRDRGP
jgi:predicted GTPase